MKEQLTFEQWLSKYVPDHKSHRCNAWNDPYQDWNHQWIMSGHAEDERNKYIQSEQESLRLAEQYQKDEEDLQKLVINQTRISEIKESICLFTGNESLYNDIICSLVWTYKQKQRVIQSSNELRDYLNKRYHIPHE